VQAASSDYGRAMAQAGLGAATGGGGLGKARSAGDFDSEWAAKVF
jgi:hypothetical protein